MLPIALAKAAKQFKVESKGEFDFNKLNKAQTNDQLKEIFNELSNYCMRDCRALWQVLASYAIECVQQFNINIFNLPTSASIAFATFRTNYLIPNTHKIAISSKAVYDIIKPAYFGGATDVYKPRNPPGTKVYVYDINSEYPAMMATHVMPTGTFRHIIGNINFRDPNFIAFVKCKVNCPINMKVPILPRIIGGKMICGVGSWIGTYFSPELKYAEELGYEIEPIEAYVFEGNLVFNEFINTVYTKRLTYPKSEPMNYICKLIMNSCYGRFGMAPTLEHVNIINQNQDPKDNMTGRIFHSMQTLDPNLYLVITKEIANEKLNLEKPSENLQISTPIAAAITSYARICIHKMKLEAANKGVLLYSDTDSLMTSEPLPNDLLGNQLGQLKLEETAEEGIFLAPKVYALHKVKIPGKNGEMIASEDIFKAKGLKRENHMQ
jgi:hypothetical protein